MSVVLFGLVLFLALVSAERPTSIKIDGNFDDWKSVRKYTDPQDNEEGTVLQDFIPDCHDTDSKERCDRPTHVYNPAVDLVEYALAHDEHNFYAYMKAAGDISLSGNGPTDQEAGRSYIQVVLDVDDNLETGFCLSGGGYYPDSCGYDLNFEIELYNGSFNLAHVILHSMENQTQYEDAIEDQKNNTVSLAYATYSPYTQWVYWDDTRPITEAERARCPPGNGPFNLPGDNHPVICFVFDKCNCRFNGVMDWAISADKHSIEFSAPFKTFMFLPNGEPTIKLGNRLTVAFTLETSPQFSDPSGWVSDASWPIRGYILEPPTTTPPSQFQFTTDYVIGGAVGLVIGAVIGIAGAVCFRRRRRFDYESVDDEIPDRR